MSHRLAAAAAIAALVLQGCATQQLFPPAPGEDFNVGIAKTCSFTPVPPVPGGNTTSTITMTNDGWCAVRVKQADGQPFELGLLKVRPEHGRVLIQSLGGETRLEYTADQAWTGTDRFTAAVRPTQGADATIQVTVNATMGEGVAPPRAAEPAKPAPTTRARAPARKKS